MPKSGTKSSEMLRKAAQRVEKGDFTNGCDAVRFVAYGNPLARDVALGYFERVAPQRVLYRETWWGGLQDRTHILPANTNARIIGLCLAAAIAESEGD